MASPLTAGFQQLSLTPPQLEYGFDFLQPAAVNRPPMIEYFRSLDPFSSLDDNCRALFSSEDIAKYVHAMLNGYKLSPVTNFKAPKTTTLTLADSFAREILGFHVERVNALMTSHQVKLLPGSTSDSLIFSSPTVEEFVTKLNEYLGARASVSWDPVPSELVGLANKKAEELLQSIQRMFPSSALVKARAQAESKTAVRIVLDVHAHPSSDLPHVQSAIQFEKILHVRRPFPALEWSDQLARVAAENDCVASPLPPSLSSSLLLPRAKPEGKQTGVLIQSLRLNDLARAQAALQPSSSSPAQFASSDGGLPPLIPSSARPVVSPAAASVANARFPHLLTSALRGSGSPSKPSQSPARSPAYGPIPSPFTLTSTTTTTTTGAGSPARRLERVISEVPSSIIPRVLDYCSRFKHQQAQLQFPSSPGRYPPQNPQTSPLPPQAAQWSYWIDVRERVLRLTATSLEQLDEAETRLREELGWEASVLLDRRLVAYLFARSKAQVEELVMKGGGITYFEWDRRGKREEWEEEGEEGEGEEVTSSTTVTSSSSSSSSSQAATRKAPAVAAETKGDEASSEPGGSDEGKSSSKPDRSPVDLKVSGSRQGIARVREELATLVAGACCETRSWMIPRAKVHCIMPLTRKLTEEWQQSKTGVFVTATLKPAAYRGDGSRPFLVSAVSSSAETARSEVEEAINSYSKLLNSITTVDWVPSSPEIIPLLVEYLSQPVAPAASSSTSTSTSSSSSTSPSSSSSTPSASTTTASATTTTTATSTTEKESKDHPLTRLAAFGREHMIALTLTPTPAKSFEPAYVSLHGRSEDVEKALTSLVSLGETLLRRRHAAVKFTWKPADANLARLVRVSPALRSELEAAAATKPGQQQQQRVVKLTYVASDASSEEQQQQQVLYELEGSQAAVASMVKHFELVGTLRLKNGATKMSIKLPTRELVEKWASIKQQFALPWQIEQQTAVSESSDSIDLQGLQSDKVKQSAAAIQAKLKE